MAERRAVTRVAPEQPLSAKVKTSLPARVVDISSRGAQLELMNCLRPNVTCELRLQLPGGEVLVRANVRRCRAWGFGLDEKDQRVLLYRAGVEFQDVSPEIVARIKLALTLPESGEFHAITVGEPVVEESVAPVVTVLAPAAPEVAPEVLVMQAPAPAAASAPVEPPHAAPRRDGPVKVRISSDHVRRILERGRCDR
jgi:hypothetical protein